MRTLQEVADYLGGISREAVRLIEDALISIRRARAALAAPPAADVLSLHIEGRLTAEQIGRADPTDTFGLFAGVAKVVDARGPDAPPAADVAAGESRCPKCGHGFDHEPPELGCPICGCGAAPTSEPRHVLDLDSPEAVERLALGIKDFVGGWVGLSDEQSLDVAREQARTIIAYMTSEAADVAAGGAGMSELACDCCWHPSLHPAGEPKKPPAAVAAGHQHRPVEIDSGTSGGGYRGHPPDVVCADCGEELRAEQET